MGVGCIWKVESIIPEHITEEMMQEIICSKVANIIINEENKIWNMEKIDSKDMKDI